MGGPLCGALSRDERADGMVQGVCLSNRHHGRGDRPARDAHYGDEIGAGGIYKDSGSCDRLLYPPRPLTHSGGAAAGRRCGGLQQERDCADAAGYAGFVRPCRRPESERQRADDSKEDVFQWRELNAGRCEFARWLSPDYRPAGGAGTEGDQIALGIKRSETFWNRKIMIGSTPTIKGISRIEKSYAESDQRRYCVPCPHCGAMQPLVWGGPEVPYGLKWKKDAQGNGLAQSAYYVCREQGCVIEETDKPQMLARGEWRAEKPFAGHAGFHLWAGYSLFPNACWPNLVAEWLRVKDDPLARQTFINLVLGEPYEDFGERALAEARLAARGEVWAAEVPEGVVLITVGGDLQDNRIELEVVGWGRNEESWSLDYHVI